MKTWKSATEAVHEKLSESGKTYFQLSEATGVPRPSLIRFINGKAGLHSDTIDKLLGYFGLVVVEKPKRQTARKRKGR